MVALVIKIDRLEIKISDISEKMVRETISTFDKEMSLQAFELLGNNDLDIIVPSSDKLDAGNLYVHEKDIHHHPNQLGKIIANKILKSILGVPEEGGGGEKEQETL